MLVCQHVYDWHVLSIKAGSCEGDVQDVMLDRNSNDALLWQGAAFMAGVGKFFGSFNGRVNQSLVQSWAW